MTFLQFLDNLQTSASLMQYPVIAFQGSTYPLLFFSLLSARLKSRGIALEVIDCAEHESSMLESKFQTSFLGTQLFFWLKDVGQLNDRTRKWLIKFITDYQGPHTIAFFLSNKESLVLEKPSICIIVPDHVDQKIVGSMATFFCKENSAIMRIYKGRDGITVDSACLLMQYAQLVGVHAEPFISQWVDKIITPERSLFTLSTYFFAKKPKPFFELLAHLNTQYSEVFWVSYWSENIWRAYHYIVLTKEKQFGEAKKIGNRLPFTFLQRDWKLHSSKHLRIAHWQLYEIDFALKNGASSGMLDLFYSKFFNNTHE